MKQIFCLCSIVLGISLYGIDIYVDNIKGNDGNDGRSLETAVKTFSKAMKEVKRGGTLNIVKNDVPYYESLILRGNLGRDGKSLIINGNGAVISGLVELDMSKFEEQDGGFFYAVSKIPSNWNPRLFDNGKALTEALKKEDCKPGSFVWLKNGFFFIPEVERGIKGYLLSSSLRDSGVMFNSAKNIRLNNIISENHGNDGFNVHGSCHSIYVENVVGRFNGDDGFSVHEDGEVFICNSEFYNNQYGLEDINMSRTFYDNVKVYDNNVGAQFAGGEHSLTACEFRNNSDQIRLVAGRYAVYLGESREPNLTTHCFIKNTTIEGGNNGISINRKTKLTMISSVVNPKGTALRLNSDSEAYVLGTALLGGRPLAIDSLALSGDKNLFFPDSIQINNQPTTLEHLIKVTESNQNSIVKEPTFRNNRIEEQPFMEKSPRLRVGPLF